MLYIIAAIFISVSLLILFKLFDRYHVNTLVAIIVNYAAASCTGLIFLPAPANFNAVTSADWFSFAVPLGGLFLFIFYLISRTAQQIGISTASIANKMSVVIPVLFSLFYLHEELSLLKIAGIGLALLAVYLSSASKSNNGEFKKLLWLPALVFVGSGLIDTTINFVNAYYVHTKNDSALFTITTFITAFICGVGVIVWQSATGRLQLRALLSAKNVLGGLLLGIPNYFSIFFIFKSLESNLLSSAQLFPVLNLCNVALASISGWLLFKEKLSIMNIVGIVLALVSIIIIAF